MRKFFALAIVFCMICGLSAQTVNLAYFPFTDNQASPNTPTSYLAEAGTQADMAGLYLDGTHGSSAWLSQADGELTANNGSTINSLNGTASGKDLAMINSTANGKSFVFHFSTTDYQNIVVSFAARYTATGFNNTAWEYSTDGTNFTALPGISTLPSATSTYELVSMDLTSVTAINEQSNVYLRCTLTGASSSNGSYRIDNVQINAVPAGPDIYAPVLASHNVVNATSMTLTFNEPMDPTTAQNTSNYVLDNGTVSQASLNENVVTLTFNPALAEGITNTLTISNVTDLAGNAMETETISFIYGVATEFHAANIAELRSKLDFSDYSVNNADNTEYKLEGEVIVTAVAAYNNQKCIQDATGAILIFDPDNKLGSLSIGDKISGIYGTLTSYYGFLEFKPTHSYENFVSILEDVTPMEITLDQLNDNTFMAQHQAELIKMNNVTFNEAGANFAVLTAYNITQNGVTASAAYPYFQDAEYIGTPIPSAACNLTGVNFATTKIGNQSGLPFRYYIVPRMNNDFGTG
ncbi:MAG: Ig-like domain-containing protein, partial [Bacteroidales bacterium]|nr:Ig-like domain-containing protein [Bacteroidales bacterium]